jgi:hypothetical protein
LLLQHDQLSLWGLTTEKPDEITNTLPSCFKSEFFGEGIRGVFVCKHKRGTCRATECAPLLSIIPAVSQHRGKKPTVLINFSMCSCRMPIIVPGKAINSEILKYYVPKPPSKQKY